MRHQLSGRQLSRNAPHRWAMLRNMAASLLRHETIRTTVPKAKELRRVVEPLITLGKADSQANRRRAFAQLRDDEIVEKLFEVLGPRYKARPGGYTRILHMEERPGDSAPMALMQLVDQPQADAGESKAEEGPNAKKTATKTKAPKKAAKVEAEAGVDTAEAAEKPKAAKKKAAKKTASQETEKKSAKKAAKKD